MCKKCLYKKNCQFLAKHKKAVVEGCTSFLSEDEYKAMIKAEVIKEFAERVKEKSSKLEMVCGGALVKRDYTIDEKILNNLAKEMAGED